MSKGAIEYGADMEEEEEVNNSTAGYLIIIAALKARKAKLKQADSQLRDNIVELQQEILAMQESNQSQDYCSCSHVGGEDTSPGTKTASNNATSMPRSRSNVLSTADTSQPITPIPTLERYNKI